MKIQIWSDFACPYCYIGKHNLEVAINQLEPAIKNQLELIYRSFELSPDAPTTTEQSCYEQLAAKYNVSLEQARSMSRRAEALGKEAGLELNFDKLIPTNTFKAHQLAHYAYTVQKAPEIVESLFQAHFRYGLNIAEDNVLLQLAEAMGLDPVQTRQALQTEAFGKSVRLDEIKAEQIRISSVPFFIVDDQFALSGVQPLIHFRQAIMEALQNKTATGEQGDAYQS